MMQKDAYSKESLPMLGLLQRKEILIPLPAGMPFAAKEQQQQHERIA
jgi:hypothetical protein